MLAKEGYVGIKRVYEREYGGFLKQFSKGNNRPEPGYLVDEIHKQLGKKWQLEGVVLKPYASMAGTHATVDCIRALQAENPELFTKDNLNKVSKIIIRLEPPMFDHGGWQAERPLTATGAQMSNMFVCATQLVENAVMAAQFGPSGLESDSRWDLVSKTKCECIKEYSDGATEVEIAFEDGKSVKKYTTSQRGVDPPLTNDEIREKFRMLAGAVIEPERSEKIESLVLDIDSIEDISGLVELLTAPTRNPLA